jgi:hypothetical protein
MIDSKQPLIKRQMSIKSHDCVKSSKLEFPVLNISSDALATPLDAADTLGKASDSGMRKPQTKVVAYYLPQGVFSETSDYTGGKFDPSIKFSC